MSKDLLVLDVNDPIREAENTFRNYSIRHAPVVSSGELAGMLSIVDLKARKDLEELEVIDEGNLLAPLSVRHLMTPDPVSIQAGATVYEAATLFVENDFHAVPVLDGNIIAGIITTTDIIRFFLELLESD